MSRFLGRSALGLLVLTSLLTACGTLDKEQWLTDQEAGLMTQVRTALSNRSPGEGQPGTRVGSFQVRGRAAGMRCSADGVVWKRVKAGGGIPEGSAIRTRQNAQRHGLFIGRDAVLRLEPDTVLTLDRLQHQDVGGEVISDVVINLVRGSILGNCIRWNDASRLEIVTPVGRARVKAAHFRVTSTGDVSVVRGNASFEVKGQKPIDIEAGQTFTPPAAGSP